MKDRVQLKACGATSGAELGELGLGGATLAGLWWEIPGSARSRTSQEIIELAESCRFIDGLEPCLVTFSADAVELANLMVTAGIRWVQLHAFQRPKMVAELRSLLPVDTVIVKVFHQQGSVCLEKPYFGAYRRAGTDVAIFDAMSEDGRIGSTGQSIPPDALLASARAVDLPFLVAGGVTADNAAAHAALRDLPNYRGVDADSATRGPDGTFSALNIESIGAAWLGAARRAGIGVPL